MTVHVVVCSPRASPGLLRWCQELLQVVGQVILLQERELGLPVAVDGADDGPGSATTQHLRLGVATRMHLTFAEVLLGRLRGWRRTGDGCG